LFLQRNIHHIFPVKIPENLLRKFGELRRLIFAQTYTSFPSPSGALMLISHPQHGHSIHFTFAAFITQMSFSCLALLLRPVSESQGAASFR